MRDLGTGGVQPWFGPRELERSSSRTAGFGEYDDPRLAGVLGPPAAAAALVVAGGLMLALPQHAVTLLRLLLGTVAVAMLALVVHAARRDPDEDDSIFERDGRGERLRSNAVPGLPAIEGSLLDTTVPAVGSPLPFGARRRLFFLAATVLDRDGIDLTDPAQLETARARVAPVTWGVIVDELRKDRSRVPPGRRRTTPAANAELVHAVLDDLHRIDTGSGVGATSPGARRAPAPGAA